MSSGLTKVMTVTLSLAELAADAAPYLDLGGDSAGSAGESTTDPPTWADLRALHRYLRVGLADLVADRDVGPERGPVTPLRLTKGRVRTAAICPAQVLAEVNPFGINFNIAVGIVCDAAAGVLALHPGFRPAGQAGWFESLRPSLAQEHPHLTEFVDRLGRSDRADFDHVVDDLSGALPELLGDLRPHRPTVHHRIAHVPVEGVQITGEIDISLDVTIDGTVGGRLVAEVKSGRFNPRITDELAHYALITTLQQLRNDPHAGSAGEPDPGADPGEPPRRVIGCSVSLGDLAVVPVTLSMEMLETSARRLLDTTKGLLAIDETMKTGGRPPTNPGDHCRWCRRVSECGDAPDLVMAEINESLRPLETLRFDPEFDPAVHGGAVDDEFDEPEVEAS